MISFISTFPPIICGIGTYTSYITERLPLGSWRMISFDPIFFSTSEDHPGPETLERVEYILSPQNPTLPQLPKGNCLWFQHAFGIWGSTNERFLQLVDEAVRRGHKVAASFHTVHFQSDETPWGMSANEEALLGEALPMLDCLTVFSNGAYKAVCEAFPQYSYKVVVLRHGVHRYPSMHPSTARKRFFNFLIEESGLPDVQKEELKRAEEHLFSPDTLLVGNFGFITSEKAPVKLYELGRLLQERLPHKRVITLFAGIVQKTNDGTFRKKLPLVEELRAIHDGRERFFFELYLPERVFPVAYRALDFAPFWCNNATQSGRLAHVQGTGVLAAGRDWEGVGETLRLSGLPADNSLEGLAGNIARLVLHPELKREAASRNARYVSNYSFENQAKKHILIERALKRGMELPTLDRSIPGSEESTQIGAFAASGMSRRSFLNPLQATS